MTRIDEKFLSEISDLPGRCAFRGQEIDDWRLNSSALRRLWNDPDVQASIAGPGFPSMYLNYHRDELLDPGRAAGFGVEEGRRISDLELLAKLQHFGAATGLVDFTWNPLIALWFACRKSKSAERGDGSECDGKVFAVNVNDPEGFRQVSHKREDQVIESVFPTQPDDRSLYWEPMINGEAAARIIGQASVFVIPRPHINENNVQEIHILSEDKAVIRKELADVFGITEEYLFRDLHGFSIMNGVESSIRLMKRTDPRIHVSKGNELYQLRKFDAAIRSYSRSIELCPRVGEMYFLRANARAEFGDYSGALADYARAQDCERPYVELSHSSSRSERRQMLKLLFNQANTRAATNDHLGAVADFDRSIQYCSSDFWHTRVVFNRANSKIMLQQLDQAMTDYDYVLTHGTNESGVPYEQARFNKGNVLVMLGQLQEAAECYRKVSNPDFRPAAKKNLEAANRVLTYLSDAKIEWIIRIPRATAGLPIQRVQICCSNMESTFEPVSFEGQIGNIGNTGGTGLPGGSGFGGSPGFSVIVSNR